MLDELRENKLARAVGRQGGGLGWSEDQTWDGEVWAEWCAISENGLGASVGRPSVNPHCAAGILKEGETSGCASNGML